MRRLAVLVILLGLGGSAASANVSFTAQSRSVDASSESIADLWELGTNPFFPDFDPPSLTQTALNTDDVAAPDFGAFTATASTTDPGVPLVPTSGTAAADQVSTLAGSSISATGDYDATTDAYSIGAPTLATISLFLGTTYNFGIARDRETGRSSFSVDFDVASEQEFHLMASGSVSDTGGFLIGDTTGLVSVELRESGGPVLASLSLDQMTCFPSCSDSIDLDLALPAGSYVLSAEAEGTATGQCLDVGGGLTCFTPTSTGSFELALTAAPPVPAVGVFGRFGLAAALAAGVRKSAPGSCRASRTAPARRPS